VNTNRTSFDVLSFLTKSLGREALSKYQVDQILFSQGDPADSVFYIHKGKVKVAVTSERGKEAIVAIRGPDEFCGEGCLTGEPLRLASTVAMAACEIMRLEKATVLRFIHDKAEFNEYFLHHLLTRTARVEADLVDQLFNSSEQRLARALLLLANVGNNDVPEAISVNVNQETLAEMIGTTRSRVNFFLNKFRKLGFIDYNGHIRVHKSLLNIVLYHEPHISS
jgi:CRP/FNR family transcriptional regulator, cyclic AMP receptor protein